MEAREIETTSLTFGSGLVLIEWELEVGVHRGVLYAHYTLLKNTDKEPDPPAQRCVQGGQRTPLKGRCMNEKPGLSGRQRSPPFPVHIPALLMDQSSP